MAVLIVLFGAWLIYRGLGALGAAALASWHSSLPFALASMFFFTGTAHFPQPMLIVYLTGVFEFLGAAGLLIPQVREWAGICLILLLLGMLVANIHAARKQMTLAGKPVTALWLRIPMQVLFIGLIWWAANLPV